MTAAVLVVGGGGREHALAWRLARSPRVGRVLVAPGNAGTAREPGVENVAAGAGDLDALVALARERRVDLTVVGPEAPLVDGIADRFAAAGLPCFGPCRAAARLEGSKAFTKEFLARHGIPSANYRTFTALDAAIDHVERRPLPMVIKADGLAAGGGVVVAGDRDQARAAVRACLAEGRFGNAGRTVVIEDCLTGEEASFICMVSGTDILALASSQDHKARDDGDRGPNTGGMGAYSPAPVVDDVIHRRILREVVEPTVHGLAADGVPYLGFLYAGLMIGTDGTPTVLEFNCRFGDPETEPILMRLQSDLYALCEAAVDGRLAGAEARWDRRAAVGVVMAAAGYPDTGSAGEPIEGLDGIDSETVKVFHAGTAIRDGRVVTNGGRVLCVTALGDGVGAARDNAYRALRRIRFRDARWRSDIGWRAIAREPKR